jgi:tetratricopeptide (TPR) repeat protein
MIVLSAGSAELAASIASLIRLEYPRVEILLIDITGHGCPPLPPLALSEGHSIRVVATGNALTSPAAANLGLEDLRGEFFGFLNDGDVVEPCHVSKLVGAACSSPHHQVTYSLAKLPSGDGKTCELVGVPFDRMTMSYQAPFALPAAIFRSGAVAAGCRFDEAMGGFAERDFLSQVATHSDFLFIPQVTVARRAGRGTARLGFDDDGGLALTIVCEARLLAKWAGEKARHDGRAFALTTWGVKAFLRGEREQAKRHFEQVLRRYPTEPNSLHGLARCHLAARSFEDARSCARKAVDMNRSCAEYHLTLALALEGLHEVAEARWHAFRACQDASMRPAACSLLARLPQSGTADVAPEPVPSRLAPCPCGSGRRIKNCCGSLGPRHAGLRRMERQPSPNPTVRRALQQLAKGAAETALDMVRRIDAETLSATDAFHAGKVSYELEDYHAASKHLVRALSMDSSQDAQELLR